MTTNKSEKVPASVSWWRMMWMILTQDTALGPYLKLWKGANPYHSLAITKIAILAVAGGLVMLIYAHKLGGVEIDYIFQIMGAVTGLLGLIIGLLHARCLIQTTTSFQCIWNSQKFELLARGEFDRGMIKAIMTPGATHWAKEALRLETAGLDRLPKGRREKSAFKRKIDTYVSACLGMGFGHGTLTHKELVKNAFSIARGTY